MEVNLEKIRLHTLESHFLINRASGADLVAVIDRLCGLNAQTARAPYLSLWSRVAGFQRDRLERELHQRRRLIKTWFMRGTVHMVPTRDFFIYRRALGSHLVEGWLDALRRRKLMLSKQIGKKLQATILELLSHGPRTRKELLPEVRHLLKDHDPGEQKMRLGWVLRELSYRGLVCHGEPTGPWYHFKEHRFETVDNWIQGQDVVDIDEHGAQRRLLIKYLRGYGPASVGDFAYWAGLKMADAKKIFEATKDELEEVCMKDQKGLMWILKAAVTQLRESDVSTTPPVKFLPEFDSLVMGHRDKSRILNEAHRKNVFLRLADVSPVFLIGGRIAGTWNYKMSTGELEIVSFEPLSSGNRGELELQARRLKAFFRGKGNS
jgi:uncharacterized protein YcaQ